MVYDHLLPVLEAPVERLEVTRAQSSAAVGVPGQRCVGTSCGQRQVSLFLHETYVAELGGTHRRDQHLDAVKNDHADDDHCSGLGCSSRRMTAPSAGPASSALPS